MVKIYLCAPNRYYFYSEKLAVKLEEQGFNVLYAAKNTDQRSEKHKIFGSNVSLINACDVFLAYFVHDGYYGIDFASETGYAAGKKKVIGFIDVEMEYYKSFMRRLDKDVMLSHFIESYFNRFEELVANIR